MQSQLKFQHNSPHTLKGQLLSYIWKSKQTKKKTKRRIKTILNNRRYTGGVTIPYFKLYYRAIIAKTDMLIKVI